MLDCILNDKKEYFMVQANVFAPSDFNSEKKFNVCFSASVRHLIFLPRQVNFLAEYLFGKIFVNQQQNLKKNRLNIVTHSKVTNVSGETSKDWKKNLFNNVKLYLFVVLLSPETTGSACDDPSRGSPLLWGGCGLVVGLLI